MKSKAPDSLSEEELIAVLAKAKEHSLRDWVMMLMLYWHGFRVSELAQSSSRQRGLFFTIAKAKKRRKEELAEGRQVEVTEVTRLVKGKLRKCYLVMSAEPVHSPGLTLQDIEGQHVTVQRLKHSEETTQPLEEHEEPILNEKLAWAEWMAERELHGNRGKKDVTKPCFVTSIFGISRVQLFRLFQRYAREAGLPSWKQHPHCLKHTIATHLVDMGMPLSKVQARLGHKSISSTGLYTLPKEDQVSREVGNAIRSMSGFRRLQQPKLF